MEIKYTRKVLIPTLLIIYFFIRCNKEDAIIPVEEAVFTEFSFLKSNNPSLANNISLEINGQSITGIVPYQTDIKNLVATFTHGGLEVLADDIQQVNGTTSNDFSKTISYKVATSNGQESIYDVTATYYTGLPIVYIDTNGVPIDSKEEYREGSVSVFGGLHYDDVEASEMKIRGRGNSTWHVHAKKPFQLKLDDKAKLFGIPKDKKWIFLAEHSDKTLMRNKIAFEMGYLSRLDWTPQSIYSEVFVNNTYNGTYHVSQKVEESSNRVDLGDTGYLLEIDQLDRLDADDVYFYTSEFLINIKEPEITSSSTEYNYVKNLFIDFEDVLKGANFKDPNEGYAKYIDVDSFIDWYLINEITKNQDARNYSSIFLNVLPNEKIKMGPIWDFDLAFGNVDYSECEFPTGFWVKDNAWYTRLFEDPTFVDKVKTRFLYFREHQVAILEKIDEYANLLDLAQKENNLKWDVIGNYQWPNPVVLGTYEEEVARLKSWYNERMDWLHTAFNNL